MLKEAVQAFLNRRGLSLHRKSTIDHLLRDNVELRQAMSRASAVQPASPATTAIATGNSDDLDERCRELTAELRKYEDRQIFYKTTEDYGAHDKMRQSVDRIRNFGEADFADLSCWLFAASLINHRVIHQRIDEGSLLWRAVKMSGGPILEVGRAAGGSTLVLLGASGFRPVISIDRAPFHAFIADQVFRRPDVASRLKLYVQTSREPIVEDEFGMMFIDADHSYEGICQDIATFWNTLESCDGKPPLAAFHDAADNPITFVEPVKHACEELVAEGAGRIVESWGSMLILEKLRNIDQDRWYKKEHFAFWEQFADDRHPILKPAVIRGGLGNTPLMPKPNSHNLFGDENVEHDSWHKYGMVVERLKLNEDNPVRLLRETAEIGEHGFSKAVPVNASRFNFTAFLRPHHFSSIRLSILGVDRKTLATCDFSLAEDSRITGHAAAPDVRLIDAQFLYRNGYFGCNLAIETPARLPSAVFAVNALAETTKAISYKGNADRGIFVNLASVRELA